MKTLSTSVLLLTLSATSSAQEIPSLDMEGIAGGPAGACLAGAPEGKSSEFPLYDATSQSGLWVRGSDYKAYFDESGLEFIPFLGSDAPHNYPVHFQLESVQSGGREIAWWPGISPEQDGDRVTFHRGALEEVYRIGADSIEQTFVLPERPGSGELALRVAVSGSVLDGGLASAESFHGLSFSNERGGVGFGRATLIDARGRRICSSTRLAGSGIEIVIPALELERAEFPLTIDPLINVFRIDDSPIATLNPDAAFDRSSGRWMCVYEEAWSAADHDIRARFVRDNGVLWDSQMLDVSGEFWEKPRTANNNQYDQFLAVAARINTLGRREIVGRTVSAWDTSTSGVIVITPLNMNVNYFNYDFPDVGGDGASQGNARYCVTFRHKYTDPSPPYELWLSSYYYVSVFGGVTGGAGLNTPRETLLSSLDYVPRISKTNGASLGYQQWLVAAKETELTTNAPRILLNCVSPSAPPYFTNVIYTPALADELPTVSSILNEQITNPRAMVAFVTAGRSIMAAAFRFDPTNYTGAIGPLVQIDSCAAGSQHTPSVDTNGIKFLLLYRKDSPSKVGPVMDVFGTLLQVSGLTLSAGQGCGSLAATWALESSPIGASKYSGGLPGNVAHAFFCAWDVSPSYWSSDEGIWGGWLDYP